MPRSAYEYKLDKTPLELDNEGRKKANLPKVFAEI